jgi:hypothetical protein
MIDFPFKVENGKVVNADSDIDTKIKRVVSYSATDIAYAPGIGAGIDDIVFSVGAGGETWKIIEDNIKKAIMQIEGILNVQISFQKDGSMLSIYVYYVYEGNSNNTVISFDTEV